MTTKKDIHIIPHADKWATKKEGNKRVTETFDTKEGAQRAGRDQAKKDKVDLVIHGKNGKIQDSDSYGNDPCPPKDKKH
jgi:hypothetical protein